MILLYDPRKPSAPLGRLQCSEGQPVTDVHWQYSAATRASSRSTPMSAARVQVRTLPVCVTYQL